MSKNSFSPLLSPTSGRLPEQYLLSPATTGVPAVGAVSTTGLGAWAAAYTAIIAALDIAVEYFICGMYIDTLGVAQVFEAQLADGTPTVLTEFRINPTAVTANLGYLPVGAFPIYMAANALVQYRAGGAAAKVIGVSLLYTTG